MLLVLLIGMYTTLCVANRVSFVFSMSLLSRNEISPLLSLLHLSELLKTIIYLLYQIHVVDVAYVPLGHLI